MSGMMRRGSEPHGLMPNLYLLIPPTYEQQWASGGLLLSNLLTTVNLRVCTIRLSICSQLQEMSPHREELKQKILECFDKQTLLQHLQDPDGWKAFHEFMESEYCGENTRFWQAVGARPNKNNFIRLKSCANYKMIRRLRPL